MKKDIKKVIKNLKDPNFLNRTEKILNITITYYDGNVPNEFHFVENDTGLRWRGVRDAKELQSAEGRVPILVNQIGCDIFCFVPENFKA